jgi:hypothetical protein
LINDPVRDVRPYCGEDPIVHLSPQEVLDTRVALAVHPVHSVQALDNAHPAAFGCLELPQVACASNDQHSSDRKVSGVIDHFHVVGTQFFAEPGLKGSRAAKPQFSRKNTDGIHGSPWQVDVGINTHCSRAAL